jgi:hypothetical protein
MLFWQDDVSTTNDMPPGPPLHWSCLSVLGCWLPHFIACDAPHCACRHQPPGLQGGIELGRIASLELNHKAVDVARAGQSVAMKIEPGAQRSWREQCGQCRWSRRGSRTGRETASLGKAKSALLWMYKDGALGVGAVGVGRCER